MEDHAVVEEAAPLLPPARAAPEQEEEVEPGDSVILSLAEMLEAPCPKAKAKGRPKKRPQMPDPPPPEPTALSQTSGGHPCPRLQIHQQAPSQDPPQVHHAQSLMVPQPRQLLKRPRHGRMGPYPLESVLQEASHLAKKADPRDLDEGVLSMAKMFLDPSYRLASQSVKLSELGSADDKTYQAKIGW